MRLYQQIRFAVSGHLDKMIATFLFSQALYYRRQEFAGIRGIPEVAPVVIR